MAELSPEIPLWAVANESRHWDSAEIARLIGDPSSLSALLRVPKGRQARLVPSERGASAPLQQRTRPVLDANDLEKRLSEAATVLQAMSLSGIAPVPLFSPDFPARLAGIPDPPLVLYILGTVSSFERCVGVSGTRTPSQWGARTAQRLAHRLAGAGWIVTSGLAKGIDTRAHRGALAAPRGRTVAVSALPLDRIYPTDNLDLARQIADRGAIVSEHGLAEGNGRVEFLRRNRITSGLSFAHFIVETSGAGGTWAQATAAKAQGRPLLTMKPPRAERTAWRGFEALLEIGAVPCRSVEAGLGEAAEIWAAQTP